MDDKCIIIFNSDVFNINIVEKVVLVLNYNDYLTVVIVYNYECNMQMYLLVTLRNCLANLVTPPQSSGLDSLFFYL